MIQPPIPHDEKERLESLKAYGLLEELPRDVFENILRIAAEISGSPVALLNIIGSDLQYTKASFGMEAGEAPREISLCAHAITHPKDVLVISDARYDSRFHDNPFTVGTPPTIFYAGVPLLDAAGHALGTLCVTDERPKELSDEKLEALKALGKLIETHLELRKVQREKEQLEHRMAKVSDSAFRLDDLLGKGIIPDQLPAIKILVKTLKTLADESTDNKL